METGDAQGGMRVGRTGDVLPEYQKSVEEYYRSIGKTPPEPVPGSPKPTVRSTK